MAEKSIVQEAKDIQLAMELISLGARLQMLESETQLSRGRLIKLLQRAARQPAAERDAAVLDRLVYDPGAEYSFVDVLQRLFVPAEERQMQWSRSGDQKPIACTSNSVRKKRAKRRYWR